MTKKYFYLPLYSAPCNSFGCCLPAQGLCWRCHQACCTEHLYLVRWSIRQTEQLSELAVTDGALVAEDDGSLLCAECARRVPDISGKTWE